MTVEEFVSNFGNIVRENKNILNCDHKSILACVFMSAELGLRFSNSSNPEGLCYILVHKKKDSAPEARFQIGYKGLIELLRRVPAIENIVYGPVFENEFYVEDNLSFKHIKYTGMELNKIALIKATEDYLKDNGFDESARKEYLQKYKAKLDKEGRGGLQLVFAAVKLKGVEKMEFESVTKDVLDAIEEKWGDNHYSAYKNNTDVHNMMQTKAAIKKLFKKLPKTGSADLSKAVKYDDAIAAGKTFSIEENTGSVSIIDSNEKGDYKFKKDYSSLFADSEFIQEEPSDPSQPKK